jgi:hypothetical protein
MSLSLQEVQRIAGEVARARNPSLAVLAATTAEGCSEYTEVTLAVRGSAEEPGLMTIGLDRSAPEPELRARVDQQLREQLEDQQSR